MEQEMSTFAKIAPASPINRLRNQVSKACLDFATHTKGIFSLTVPVEAKPTAPFGLP